MIEKTQGTMPLASDETRIDGKLVASLSGFETPQLAHFLEHGSLLQDAKRDVIDFGCAVLRCYLRCLHPQQLASIRWPRRHPSTSHVEQAAECKILCNIVHSVLDGPAANKKPSSSVIPRGYDNGAWPRCMYRCFDFCHVSTVICVPAETTCASSA